MTGERMALIELVEKQADGDLVREMLAFAAERITEAEPETRAVVAHDSKKPASGKPGAVQNGGGDGPDNGPSPTPSGSVG